MLWKDQDAGHFRVHTVWKERFLKKRSRRCSCSAEQAAFWRVGRSLCVCFINTLGQGLPALWGALCWIAQRQSVNPLHAWLEKLHHHTQQPVWQKQLILVTWLFLQVQKNFQGDSISRFQFWLRRAFWNLSAQTSPTWIIRKENTMTSLPSSRSLGWGSENPQILQILSKAPAQRHGHFKSTNYTWTHCLKLQDNVSSYRGWVPNGYWWLRLFLFLELTLIQVNSTKVSSSVFQRDYTLKLQHFLWEARVLCF